MADKIRNETQGDPTADRRITLLVSLVMMNDTPESTTRPDLWTVGGYEAARDDLEEMMRIGDAMAMDLGTAAGHWADLTHEQRIAIGRIAPGFAEHMIRCEHRWVP